MFCLTNPPVSSFIWPDACWSSLIFVYNFLFFSSSPVQSLMSLLLSAHVLPHGSPLILIPHGPVCFQSLFRFTSIKPLLVCQNSCLESLVSKVVAEWRDSQKLLPAYASALAFMPPCTCQTGYPGFLGSWDQRVLPTSWTLSCLHVEDFISLLKAHQEWRRNPMIWRISEANVLFQYAGEVLVRHGSQGGSDDLVLAGGNAGNSRTQDCSPCHLFTAWCSLLQSLRWSHCTLLLHRSLWSCYTLLLQNQMLSSEVNSPSSSVPCHPIRLTLLASCSSLQPSSLAPNSLPKFRCPSLAAEEWSGGLLCLLLSSHLTQHLYSPP